MGVVVIVLNIHLSNCLTVFFKRMSILASEGNLHLQVYLCGLDMHSLYIIGTYQYGIL